MGVLLCSLSVSKIFGCVCSCFCLFTLPIYLYKLVEMLELAEAVSKDPEDLRRGATMCKSYPLTAEKASS